MASLLEHLNTPSVRSNVNSWWGAATAEMLFRLGIERVVISPGSRSTPLTVAIARNPELRHEVVLDERSAGFYALGMAKASHRPVALVCTSGSAVANYLPAVIEASEGGVPLLVLSADRPPELRYRHAGQTIDQVKLFGGAARFYGEAPVPEGRLTLLASWRDLLAQAIARSQGDAPGPVHLNCPFRDPLAPGKSEDSTLPHLEASYFDQLGAPVEGVKQIELPVLPSRGWIVAGPANPRDPDAYRAAVVELSARLGWPVLADATNPCRFADFPVISGYDLILRSDAIAETGRPEAILQLGDLPTSKVLRQRLSEWSLPTWMVDPGPDSRNASLAPTRVVRGSVETLRVSKAQSRSTVFTDYWNSWEASARAELDCVFGAFQELAEPCLAAVLPTLLPADASLFVASSMPVRDAEYFWRSVEGQGPRVFCNRGANGIDGTLSTALGVARASGRPTVLYTGDLALLHDANGMLIAGNNFTGSLTVVLVNNGGGGIFGHLPIAAQEDIFERCFGTPQTVNFARWAGAFGVDYLRVESVSQLAECLRGFPDAGVRVLEIITDRKRDAAARKAGFQEALEAVEAHLGELD